MKETQLPQIEKFYTNLKHEHITKENYELATNNWKILNCKNMKDYTIRYLELNVYLLADVYENFRKMCLNYYGIDPCNCYSALELTWQSGSKFTRVKQKKYKEANYDQLIFLEKGTWGGFSGALGERLVEVNYELTTYFNQKENGKQ